MGCAGRGWAGGCGLEFLYSVKAGRDGPGGHSPPLSLDLGLRCICPPGFMKPLHLGTWLSSVAWAPHSQVVAAGNPRPPSPP